MNPLPRESRTVGLLLLAAALAYSQILGGSFQYDDFNVIVDDPGVHSLGAWAAGLGGLRPLLKLSYALNWRLSPAPAGFLAVNLAIHLLNTWMVHRLLLAVGGRAGLESRRIGIAAFGGALLFALHPLQTEAVAYVCGRSSSLSAALMLACVLAYLRGRDTGRWVWSALISPGFFLLALLTKETALALPLALTLLEVCEPEGRRRPFRGPWVHWLLTVAGAVSLAVHPGYRRYLAFGFGIRGIGDQIRGALEGFRYLFTKLLWPAGLNLDPPLTVPGQWSLPLAAVAVLLIALGACGIWALRRHSWLGFGLLWGLIFLLPTQGPVPRLDLANERHLYLSMAGFAFVFSGLLSLLPWRAFVPAVGGLALALGIGTAVRVKDYRNEVTLWESSLSVAPQNPRAWNNLGVALFEKGDAQAATHAFREALRLKPGYSLAAKNLESVDQGSQGPAHR